MDHIHCLYILKSEGTVFIIYFDLTVTQAQEYCLVIFPTGPITCAEAGHVFKAEMEVCFKVTEPTTSLVCCG